MTDPCEPTISHISGKRWGCASLHFCLNALKNSFSLANFARTLSPLLKIDEGLKHRLQGVMYRVQTICNALNVDR
jgi:hypothetical protein